MTEAARLRRRWLTAGDALFAALAVAPRREQARARVNGGASAGADPAPAATFVYEAVIRLEGEAPVGGTPRGRRNCMPITGGTVEGPDIRATVLPGGICWPLIRSDGFIEVYSSYMMRIDDGAVIRAVDTGVLGPGYWRTTPCFQAPDGPHAWFNQAVFVGTIALARELRVAAVRSRVFKVT